LQNKFSKRIDKLTQELRNRDISKALITNPSNIFYLTGIDIVPRERFIGLVISSQCNELQLIIPELEKGDMIDNEIIEVLYNDNEDPLIVLTDILGECSLLGVEKIFITLLRAEILKRNLETRKKSCCNFIEIGDILDKMRLCKEESEIEDIKLAANCIDEILYNVKNKIKVSITEKEIKYEILREISLKKDIIGPAFDIQVSGRLNAARPHGKTEDKKIAKGDSLIIDCGVNYRHYRSDITRTFFVGEPEKELQKIYYVVLEAQKKAIEMIRPGIAIKEVDIAARKVIEEAGYGKYFLHRLGHGIGLDIHEPPSIHNLNEEILEEGMVFTVEPGIYILGLGGVRIEDDIIVSRGGRGVLTMFPKEFKDIIIY